MGRAAEHPEDCRCGDCWPFRVGSEAERRWESGERVDRSARITVRYPRPVERVGGFLPGDLEIQAARAEAARGLGFPVLTVYPPERNDADSGS